MPNESLLKPKRIVVIGAGEVGSTTAYTLLLRNRADEIVLIDVAKDKALGDALDMSHGIPFVGGVKVWAGTYADCATADLIIITAGTAQRPGETRQDLLGRNSSIISQIVKEVTTYNHTGILLMATNPVDVLTYLAWKVSGWDASKVIGSGTLLDSARFRYLIGTKLSVDPRSVHAHIVGEHGDTELPVWSRANITGVPIDINAEERELIFQQTKQAAYQIIEAKGYTSYAIALALDRICTAILSNEHAVLSVSSLLQDYHGISDVYLGVPCVIGRSGIERVIDLGPSNEELQMLQQSAKALRERIDWVMDTIR
jgi:L-lactate dehydrogenase